MASNASALAFTHPKLPERGAHHHHHHHQSITARSLLPAAADAAVARRPVASPGLAVAGSPAAHFSMAAKWAQKTVVIPAQRRGCHLITPKILREIEADLSGFKCGLAHLFLQHTSASLTINENYDSDVQADTETFLNRIVPEGIWLCEHRDNASSRKIVVTLNGV
uniref:Secondary thiamine-phosphate synthase enzyme n=1 Tax=Oryza meridionalis TaxID=40149 RepID=A0A0E0CGZ5_9ORYZ